MTLPRILKIVFVFLRYRLDRLLPEANLLRRMLSILPTPRQHVAVSARLALEELGPVFVKLGQVLSTRRDLFDEDTWVELQRLQDRVPPFDGEQARTLIEKSMGAPFETDFRDFDPVPIASASVAQVHTAIMCPPDEPEREVVIKIIRPGIEKTIRADLRVMYFIARTMERFVPDSRRLHPVAVVEDYDVTIINELNLLKESANTIRLRENWKGSGKLHVPEVFPLYGRPNVMVMERIYGVTATDLEAMRKANVNMKKLAHLGVEIFFTQVFEDNFFHADMHPGNVFIDISNPENPTYIALDCAIIGSLTENDKSYLAKNLLAFFNRDYYEVARLHVSSGWVPVDTDVDEFAAVIRGVCDPMFQKPISEISFGNVLLSLFQTARHFNMEVQPQLVLLQKTLINIEGMGRQIYPDLDLWETAAPFMKRFMTDRIGITGILRRLGENAPSWLEVLPDLPDMALQTMTDIRTLSEHSQEQAQTLSEVKTELALQARRSRYQKLGGAALIAALLSLLIPTAGYAADLNTMIPGAVLGSLGIYWMYVHA